MTQRLSDEDYFGLSRVVDARGMLPQMAARLDPSLPLRPGELLLDVDHLHLDAASFQQLHAQCAGEAVQIAQAVAAIVGIRGKMHNPATGSGGVLIGRLRDIDARHPGAGQLQPGEHLITLASLSLTPLHLLAVPLLHAKSGLIEVSGHAILFASAPFARLPADLPAAVALAALDVCGAPAWTARLAKPGMRIAVLGAGKSGALCLAQARRSLQGHGQLIAVDIQPAPLQALQSIGLCDEIIAADVRQPLELLGAIRAATGGDLCDLVINCTTVTGAEGATVLTTRDGGTALFFSMATDFRAATLGAEGAGRDIRLLMGNGFAAGHAALTLDLLRTLPPLRELFTAQFATSG